MKFFFIYVLLLCEIKADDSLNFFRAFSSKHNTSLNIENQYYSPHQSTEFYKSKIIFSTSIKKEDKSHFILQAKGGVFNIGSTSSVPSSLWDTSIGAIYKNKFKSNDAFGFSSQIGSPSNRPFNSFEEISLITNGFYHLNEEQNKSWIFILNYSNNRSFFNHIPLPGFAYLVVEPQQWKAIFGIPFTSVWSKISHQVSIAGSIAPFYLRTDFFYRFLGPFHLYQRFLWEQQRYFRANRTEKKSRVFYDEKKLSIGIFGPASKNVVLDLSINYLLNRHFKEGVSYLKSKDLLLNVNGGMSFLLSANVGF